MRSQAETRLARQRGFTLTEILVAISIFSIVMVAALLMYDRNSRVFKSGVENADAQQNTRVAFDKLVSDIRMMGYDYDRDGFPTTAVATIWQANLDYDPGDVVIPPTANGFTYICITGGTSGGSQPSWSTTIGDIFPDGPNVTWQVTTTANQFQQPDEQIEYAGPAAITIRGNFDFETDTANENGREMDAAADYESAQFPVVTTGNDEIVTYALVSKTSSANDDSIQFYVDMNTTGSPPSRRAYPGGSAERQITISNVDLSNANPPYTLYRISFDHNANEVRTPLADNIRSMTFQYFQDGTGNTPLQNLAGTDVSSGTAVLGAGQYNPDTPNALVEMRVVRSRIKAVRATLVGMTENPDYEYNDSTDLASIANYRKYRLESLIVPRNVGKRGLREQDTNAPGPPELNEVGFGNCGHVTIKWSAPAAGGAVEQYAILYDTDLTGGFAFARSVGLTFQTVIDIPMSQINQTWYFTVAAQNSFGTTPSTDTPLSGIPLNRTKPQPPSNLAATPSADAISLTWTIPTLNVAADLQDALVWQPSGNAVADPTGIPNSEIASGGTPYVRVFRGSTDAFAPIAPPAANATTVWVETATGANAPSANFGTRVGLFNDTQAAHCVDYFYRIQMLDACGYDAAKNNHPTAGPNGFSDIYPLAANDAVGPFRTLTTNPADPNAPGDLTIDATSACDASGDCTIRLSWPKVVADVNSAPMTIDLYRVEVQRYVDLGTGAYVPDTQTGNNQIIDASGFSFEYDAVATYEVTNLPQNDPVTGLPYQYGVKVRAVSCSAESDDSPERRWPCVFSGGSPTISTSVLDGSGSAADPWIVYGAPNVTIDGINGTVTSITANLYKAGVPIAADTQPGPFGSGTATFGLPDLDDDGVPYSMTITFTDATGCTLSTIRYFLGSSSPCCIIQHDPPDAIQVNFSAGSAYVEIELENQCGDNLAIQSNGLKFKWSSGGLAGGTRVDYVEYPGNAGNTPVKHNLNTNASPFTSTPPATAFSTIHGAEHEWAAGMIVNIGDVVVPAGAAGSYAFKYVATTAGTTGATAPSFPVQHGVTVNDNGVIWSTVPRLYTIRVYFTKNLPLNPIKDVCVTYIRGTDAATVCKVVDLNATPTANCD